MAGLQSNEYFNRLTSEQKHIILANHQLLVKPELNSLDARGLFLQLQKASLYTWDTKIAALPSQFQSALEDTILLLAPKAQIFSVPRITISNQAEMDTFVTDIKSSWKNYLKMQALSS